MKNIERMDETGDQSYNKIRNEQTTMERDGLLCHESLNWEWFAITVVVVI